MHLHNKAEVNISNGTFISVQFCPKLPSACWEHQSVWAVFWRLKSVPLSVFSVVCFQQADSLYSDVPHWSCPYCEKMYKVKSLISILKQNKKHRLKFWSVTIKYFYFIKQYNVLIDVLALFICFILLIWVFNLSTSSRALFRRTSVLLWLAAACLWDLFRSSTSWTTQELECQIFQLIVTQQL